MTGMDLGAGPSYPAPMIRCIPSPAYRNTAGFPQDSVPSRALARLC